MTSILKVDTIQNAAGGTPTAADLGLNVSGSVLQVVEGAMGDRLAISTGGNWTQVAGLTASITPISATSKILIQCNINVAGNAAAYTVGGRLYVNGSHLSDASSADTTYSNAGVWFAASAQEWSNYFRESVTAQYLHSPVSTAQQTYSIYVNDQRNSSTVYVNRYHYAENGSYMHTTRSNIILMEIAG
jgi:hypothetical protein